MTPIEAIQPLIEQVKSLKANEPAFPQIETKIESVWDSPVANVFSAGGMTYRQWLIGMIASGYHSIPDERICPKDRLNDVESWRNELHTEDAQAVIRSTDAIIAELEKGSCRTSMPSCAPSATSP